MLPARVADNGEAGEACIFNLCAHVAALLDFPQKLFISNASLSCLGGALPELHSEEGMFSSTGFSFSDFSSKFAG